MGNPEDGNPNQLFLSAWVKTGNFEKGYVNNPNDAGGETNGGITIAVARAYGYTGPMKDLPRTTQCDIAKKHYWDTLCLDDICAVSEKIADELFDTGFLHGVGVAAMFAQKALNLFNRSNRTPPDYPETQEDARLGKLTAHTMATFLKIRGADGEKVMLACLNCQQGSLMMELGRAHANDEDFEFGWFLNRVVEHV